MSSLMSITVKFSYPPTNNQDESVIIEKRFDESNCEPARLGLPPGVEAVKVRLGGAKAKSKA